MREFSDKRSSNLVANRPVREIRSLTAVRGLGALYVMLFHAYLFFEIYTLPGGAENSLLQDNKWIIKNPLFGHGYLGVDLFFILSGYVMHYVYADAFFSASGKKRLMVFRRFLTHRVARVYPMHVVVLTGVIFYTALKLNYFHLGQPSTVLARYPVGTMLLNYALLQRIIPCPSIVIPAWSVSVEMLSYALFPLLLLLFATGSRIVAVGIAALAFAALGCVEAHTHGLLHNFTEGYYPALRGVAGFALGMVAFRLSNSAKVRGVIRHPVFLAGAILAMIVLLDRNDDDRLTVAIFVLLVAALGQDTTMAERIFCNRFLLWIGTISYSVYLIHMPLVPLMFYLNMAFARMLPPAWIAVLPAKSVFLAEYLLFAALVLMIASSTYRWIETPARRWLRDALDRPAPTVVPEHQLTG